MKFFTDLTDNVNRNPKVPTLVIVISLLLVGMMVSLGAPRWALANGPVLYSVSSRDDQLRVVNPADGSTISSVTITLPGKTVYRANGLATDPTTGKLWAVLRTVMGFPGVRELGTIDPTTGVATSVGNLNDAFSGLAFDCDGTLYGVTGYAGDPWRSLFTLDKTNATRTFMLTFDDNPDVQGQAIAFNPDDGLMYHASGLGDQNIHEIFETIDLDTLDITNVPLSGDDYTEALALTYAGSGTFLLMGNYPELPSKLFSITTGGVLSEIGLMDHAAKGFAFEGVVVGCVEAPQPVAIDIKPGSYPNSINLCSNGGVPVAILGSDTVSVSDIHTETLRFAEAAVKVVGKKDPHTLCSVEDINGDMFDDLVCHYLTTDIAALDGESTTATVNGELLDGTPIEGSDSVNIVKDTCQ